MHFEDEIDRESDKPSVLNQSINQQEILNRSLLSKGSGKCDSCGRQDEKDGTESRGMFYNCLSSGARRLDELCGRTGYDSKMWLLAVTFTGLVALFVLFWALTFTLGHIKHLV